MALLAINSSAVTLASDDVVVPAIGAVTEAAPASDTASSGLNGRLQRVAQRLTTLISVFPASVGAVTYVDRSGTITLGGTAQVAAALNAARRGFSIQNSSAGDVWFNTLATAVLNQPSYKIAAGGTYEFPAHGVPTGAVSIIGATTAQAFSAREW